MIIPLPWLVAGGTLVVCSIVVGVTQHRLDAARLETAEYRRAYDLLADRAKACSAGVHEAEQRARQAAETGRRARQEAAAAVEVATKSADALGQAMAAPRTISSTSSECSAALPIVRADLSR